MQLLYRYTVVGRAGKELIVCDLTVGFSARCIQLTHSLESAWFLVISYQLISWFQSLPFKFNLHRYITGTGAQDAAIGSYVMDVLKDVKVGGGGTS
jgi:hypothetical protein